MTLTFPQDAIRRTRTEGEARAQILARHAAELNALIRKADAEFAEKVQRARNAYTRLLRSLPWDYQKDQRQHDFILFCEELIGEGVGEQMAWEIICRGGIT